MNDSRIHTASTPPLQTDPCAVATLPSGPMVDIGFAAYFSTREWRQLRRITHGGRSTRWLAGRLAAKHLFLRRLRGEADAFHALDAPRLRTFAPEAYQRVEILADPSGASRAPRLFWRGQPHPAYRVSITHAVETTCACLADDGDLGMDLEQTAPRREAFYRGNFSEAERRWVDQTHHGEALAASWLFTLLWTLKEAALKASLFERPLSVWDFPRVEVRLAVPVPALVAVARGPRLGHAFVTSRAQIAGPTATTDVAVALTATRDLVLSILNR